MRGRVIGLPEIPGYVLEREIGAGGMARVYLAVQSSLDRKVALKVMAPALVADPAFSKRFLREARTLAGLTHPNIVAVYDVGATDTQLHYFAMQHLDNGDLAGRIASGMAEPDLVRVITAIAKALGFAHLRGVVHRDVTPGNIMFDSANNPVLTDFGIARSQHGSTRITHTGVSIGTSSYMSPEQARGGEVDQRSDLYSLGALTFEALCGHPPYQGADGFAVAYAHVFEPIPRLPASVAHWQPFIDKVLAKDPSERFDNAEQFSVALSDVPVSAHRRVPQRASASKAPVPVTSTASANTAEQAATLKMPLPSLASKTPVIDERALAPIKKSLPEATSARPALANAVDTSGSKRGLILTMAAVLALALGAGGWWLGQRSKAPNKPDFVQASEPAATPQVAPTPPVSVPSSTPQNDSTNTAVLNEAGDLVDASVDPNAPIEPDPLTLGSSFGPPTRAQYVKPWVDTGNAQSKKALCFVPRSGAIEFFRRALSIDPGNAGAQSGIDACFALTTAKVDAFLAAKNSDFDAFLLELDEIQRVADTAPAQAKERLLLQTERKRVITELMQRARPLETKWQGSAAVALYQKVLRLEPGNNEAKTRSKSAAGIGQPGFQFSDTLKSGSKGPAMRVIGMGEVVLRESKGASARARITQNFAVARTEVSFGEFSKFVSAANYAGSGKGCNNKEGLAMFVSKERTWSNPGAEFQQSDRSPVVCVDHNDALAYVRWLSAQTGENYRLLSEAEWQFLAQSAPRLSCRSGNLADVDFGKIDGGRNNYTCQDGFARTSPVGSFASDSNGLVDLVGNVREWVADCWNASLTAHPKSQAPWTSGRCNAHVVMGTAWVSPSSENLVQARQSFDQDARNNTVGFRVARDVIQVSGNSDTSALSTPANLFFAKRLQASN